MCELVWNGLYIYFFLWPIDSEVFSKERNNVFYPQSLQWKNVDNRLEIRRDKTEQRIKYHNQSVRGATAHFCTSCGKNIKI